MQYRSNTELEELLDKTLTCSSILEEAVADVYFQLRNKINDPHIALVFETISQESRKHASILRSIAILVGLKRVDVDCREYLGELYASVEHVLSRLQIVKELSKDEVRDIVEKLYVVEYFAGEETYHKLLLPLVRELLPASSKLIEELINKIIEDEEFHERAVKIVLESIR